MDITKETVEAWLTEHHRGRQWLADKCDVSVAAVGHWLKKVKPRPVPSNAKLIIERLMSEDHAASKAKPPHNLVLEFDDEDYISIEGKALDQRETIRDWAKQVLLNAAHEDMETFAKTVSHLSVVAEEDEAYNYNSKPDLYAAAGTPIFAEDIIWDDENGIVTVGAVGGSMTPLVEDGDSLVMTHKSRSRSPYMAKGLVYLIRYNGGYAIKKYGTRPPIGDEKDSEFLTNTGKVGQLLSLNKDHPPIEITSECDWDAWYDPKNPAK